MYGCAFCPKSRIEDLEALKVAGTFTDSMPANDVCVRCPNWHRL